MTYYMKSETLKDEMSQSYQTNSIIAKENGVILCQLHDVEIDSNEVTALVEQLNLSQVSLIHLTEIVEDWVAR